MRPTAFGIKALVFYATIITAYYVSPYTNLFFLMLSFLSTLLVVGCFSAMHNIARVEICLLGLTPYAANSRHEVRISLRAAKRTRFHLNIELVIAGKRHLLGTVQVLRGKTEFRGLLPELPRGVHTITALRSHSDYPLGILRCFRSSPITQPLVVHPRSIEADGHKNGGVVDEVIGELATRSGDMGPSGIREYRSGDPLKLIHWKASARRQELVVKEFEDYAAPGIEIQLDRRCPEEAFEHALSLVTALSFRARDAKRPLVLHTQGSSETYGEDHQPFNELLSLLAELSLLDADSPPPPSVSPNVIRLPRPHQPSAMQGVLS